MNTVEIRLTTTGRLDEALALPADAIGIGQEGCLTKLPDADTLRRAADRVIADGRSFVLVAPIAWPRTADQVCERLLAVATAAPVTIAVNDVGTALTLSSAAPSGCTLVAGLGLTRARPHSGDPDDATPPAPLLDVALLDLLPALRAVEVDTETDTAGAASRQIRQVVDAVPVGWGRSCPTARRHRTGPPDCRPLCDTPYTISAHQRWRLQHGHREPLPAGTERPTLTVWGNAVHAPVRTAPTAGYRILDARRHTPDALAAAVTASHGPAPVPVGR
ncbi:hypothetical protein [Mangrovihabitans endophyticus]|uniref:Uncharacterized protein n=1 Tax=Mangrovihabitans endophyticus TaxID=1751298 RepID=A0A8J3BU76_9ACTN|nr:hypothetical protein [Mangrovihabitans endophyticus]GGK78251.1 hypothetical protein GCM10012284_10190 [Mangrovihabitans endophyticus]